MKQERGGEFGNVQICGGPLERLVNSFFDVVMFRKSVVAVNEVVVLEHPDRKREVLQAGACFQLLGGYRLLGQVCTGLHRHGYVSRAYCGGSTLRIQESWTYNIQDYEAFVVGGGRDTVERAVQEAMHQVVRAEVKRCTLEGVLSTQEVLKKSVGLAVREVGSRCGVEVQDYTVDLLSYEKRL